MTKTFSLEGHDYQIDDLSEQGKRIWSHLALSISSLDELKANHALLNRAKNAYIADLKRELVEQKSGVNLDALFADD